MIIYEDGKPHYIGLRGKLKPKDYRKLALSEFQNQNFEEGQYFDNKAISQNQEMKDAIVNSCKESTLQEVTKITKKLLKKKEILEDIMEE